MERRTQELNQTDAHNRHRHKPVESHTIPSRETEQTHNILHSIQKLEQRSRESYLASITISAACLATISAAGHRPIDAPATGMQWQQQATVTTGRSKVTAHTMIDTGSGAFSLTSSSFVKQQNLDTVALEHPKMLRLADGTVMGEVTHVAIINLTIGAHTEQLSAMITNIVGYDIILGQPWIDHHEVALRGGQRVITFDSDYCLTNCLSKGAPCTVTSKNYTLVSSEHGTDIATISPYAFMRLSERPEYQVTALWPADFEALDRKDEPPPMSWLRDEAAISAISAQDYEKFREKLQRPPPSRDEILKRIPKEFQQHINAFDPRLANKLPPHRHNIDHEIKLQEGAKIPARRVYGMARDQARVVRDYIEEMLGKGFIRPSTSQFASPVLCVSKPGGGIRVCVDYRALNELTVKNRNTPPLIQETLSRISGSTVFSKFDVIAAFNEIRVREGDEHKTAFLTRYGLYEYLVMPFGLCNAPATFQSYINSVLRPFLDTFCTAYLDDVLVYSSSRTEHVKHVNLVLEALQKAGLFLDIDKSEFFTTRVKYLGIILTTDGILMDPAKVDAIRTWETPKTLKQLQAFLGFCNFYRRFIRNYSSLTSPLTKLTRTEFSKTAFPWAPGSPPDLAFHKLRAAFTQDLMLLHFDPDKETWVETDASDWVYAAVLSQKDRHGVLRPVAFMSKKMIPAECNYDIYDKELLAIVRAFEEWESELMSTGNSPVQVFTDHQNLRTFMSTKKLTRRQARWAEFLSQFHFKVTYRTGNTNTKADSLTRRPQDLPQNASDPRIAAQNRTVLQSHQLDTRVAVSLASILVENLAMEPLELAAVALDETLLVAVEGESILQPPTGGSAPAEGESLLSEPTAQQANVDPSEMQARLVQLSQNDPLISAIRSAKRAQLHLLPPGIADRNHIELGDAVPQPDGTILYRKRVFVPDDIQLRLDILRSMHDHPIMGHGGRETTHFRLSRNYYWPRMHNDVQVFVKSCKCAHSKANRRGKQGLLRAFDLPDRFWGFISVDFAVGLPPCLHQGVVYRHIMIVVDRLSRTRRFIPIHDLSVETMVQAFVDHVWKLTGWPDAILSDRGSQFTSAFWSRLCQRLGVKLRMTTAYHPEGDGITERAIGSLKQYLRSFVNHQQNDWVKFLATAEFEANTAVNSSTGLSPFVAINGYQPRTGLEAPASKAITKEARDADNFAKRHEALKNFLREQLTWAQTLQAEQANKARRPAPDIRPGDLVKLDIRNIQTSRPSKSLDMKFHGPFRVVKKIDTLTYKLDIPKASGIHPVFHAWLLHPVHEALPGQNPNPPPPEDLLDDAQEDRYIVDAVVDSRLDKRATDPATGKRGMLQYKAHYAGWIQYNQRPDWQDYTLLDNCDDLIDEFHRSNPDKPGPHALFKARRLPAAPTNNDDSDGVPNDW